MAYDEDEPNAGGPAGDAWIGGMRRGLGPAASPTPPEVDAYSLPDDEVERALLEGDHDGLLEDYFGGPQLAELRELARKTSRAPSGKRVLILPGIMGSRLGEPARPWPDVIWMDPLDIARGRLEDLKLGGVGERMAPCGVFLPTYLKLKLRLKLAGFKAEFFAYDWRRTLPELGRALAARLEQDAPDEVHLVAHSMGGLVARACLAHAPTNLGRIVMLGTPNYGSLSPVQAFRGTSDTVHKLDQLDRRHDAAELAAIFATFPGLMEMIPSPARLSSDLFDLGRWPAGGFRPPQAMLDAARAAQSALPDDYDRMVLVAGAGLRTAVDVAVANDEFVYTHSYEGDGTVPLALARIDAAAQRTYFVKVEHGALPNAEAVIAALPALLTRGETSDLPSRREPAPAPEEPPVPERRLVPAGFGRGAAREFSAREKRRLIEEFAAPAQASPPAGATAALVAAPAAPAPATGAAAPTRPRVDFSDLSDGVTTSRRRQHRLDVTLAQGGITEAVASCYVVGLYRVVDPSGPARAIDAQMDGAISRMHARRMFGANVGEVSIVPAPRPLRAGHVALVGLGDFDQFSEDTLETVGENLVRALVAFGVEDFAVVPIGAGSGKPPAVALQRMTAGFLTGLREADPQHSLRAITICEADPDRYAELCRNFHQITGARAFDDFEVTRFRRELPEPATVRGAGSETLYLTVRHETDDADRPGFTASVLPPSGSPDARAGLPSGWQPVDETALNAHLDRLKLDERDPEGVGADQLEAFGDRLAELVLPDAVRQVLAKYPQNPMVIVHDAGASRVPWETVRIGGRFPALGRGLFHRYESRGMSVAKWLEARQLDAALDVLLVVNPTRDLPGAQREGEQLKALLTGDRFSAVRLTVVEGDEATRPELLRHLSSGAYDLVHYAGHAFFDALSPERSGLLCANGEVLSGDDLATIGKLPALMVFNACEAARIRKTVRGGEPDLPAPAEPAPQGEQVKRNVSFAEAMIRGGVANYIGTYWPVGDDAAKAFSETFYPRLLARDSLGEALLAAREAVKTRRSRDWANYILYGDPRFQLKADPNP